MKKIMYLFIAIVVATFAAEAQNSDPKGLEIARKADLTDQGFKDSQVNLTMVLKNKHGQETERQLVNKTFEVVDDGDKSFIEFLTPRDVKGTAILTYSHKQGPDDQWLYLPAIKRIKRISSSNKSGPFMGSEFAYEDISSQEVEKYTYKFLKEDEVKGIKTFVIERYPVDPKSGYTRQIVWWNKENYRLEKIEFYDRKNALLKTLTYSGYKLYKSKFWRPDKMEMINHQSDKSTVLIFKDYRFQIGLTDNDFSQKALLRAGI